jgi:hypothetical protein
VSPAIMTGERGTIFRITNPGHEPEIHKEIPAPSQAPNVRSVIKILGRRATPDTPVLDGG